MLPDGVSTLYTDDQLNFVFNTHYFEESVEDINTTDKNCVTSVNFKMGDQNELIKL